MMSNAIVGSALSLPKIAIAGAAVAALAFAPILLNGSIAHAATIQVGASDVQPVEIGGVGTEPDYNYDQWHIGNATAGQETQGNASFNFDNPAGITLIPRSVTGLTNSTLLIKGYTPPTFHPLADGAALQAFIEAASVAVVSGTVNFQFAGTLDPGGLNQWVTFRPYVPHGSTTGVALSSAVWTSSNGTINNAISGNVAGTYSFADLISHVGASSFTLYAVGVSADNGNATVASISFGGDTYNFASPTPGGVETAATAANNGAFIAGIAILATLGLAVTIVAVRRNVKA